MNAPNSEKLGKEKWMSACKTARVKWPALLFWAGTFLLLSAVSSFACQIATDKLIYQQGEKVTVTGKAWQPGEVVTLCLEDGLGSVPVETIKVTADASGTFSDNSLVMMDYHTNMVLLINAHGGSGKEASIAIRDGVAPGSLRCSTLTPAGTTPFYGLRQGSTVACTIEGVTDLTPGQRGGSEPVEVMVTNGSGSALADSVSVAGSTISFRYRGPDNACGTAVVSYGPIRICGHNCTSGCAILSSAGNRSNGKLVSSMPSMAAGFQYLDLSGNPVYCQQPAQLKVVTTPSNAVFSQGSQISYKIVVSNPAPAGSGTASNVMLTDVLPTNGGLDWQTVTPPDRCQIVKENNNTVETLKCSLGNLAPQASVTVTVMSTEITPPTACTCQPNDHAVATSGTLMAEGKGYMNCNPVPELKAECAAIEAVQNRPIFGVQLYASGGSGTGYTFSSPKMPPGLAISTTGFISGIPTESGTFNYTVMIMDSAGNVGSINCSVTVSPPYQVNLTCASPEAAKGVSVTGKVAAGGGIGAYKFTASALPPGLMMASDGTVSGTPTQTGTFRYSVQVKDSNNVTATTECSITVREAPALSLTKTPSTTQPLPGQAVVYTYKITNTGGVTLTNITLRDDNATPNDPSDDYVRVIPTLARGASMILTNSTVPSKASILGTLGAVGPTRFAVLSLGGDSDHRGAGIYCSNGTVNGNLGIAGYGKFTNMAPCVENGSFYKGVNVSYRGPGKLNGSVVTDDGVVNALRDQAFAASAYFAGLAPTPSVQSQFPASGSIGGTVTVTGTPGLNVVKLSALRLNGNLVLKGDPGTQFILNVSSTFDLHSGNITTAGGVGTYDVIYNITNPSAAVKTMVPTTAVGILLAPRNAISAMDSAYFYGEVIGGYNNVITLLSGTRVLPPVPPPATVKNKATATGFYGTAPVSADAFATVTVQTGGSNPPGDDTPPPPR